MGLFTKVEDRPTPKNVYNWRVYACAAMAGSAAIMIGYDSAFIGTTIALPSFKKEFNMLHLSTDALNLLSANIVSCYQAGAFFGAIAAYVAAFFLGRTSGLAVFSAIFVLGSGLMLGANGERGLGLIYAGRVLAGFGVGGASNLAPIYISEISPPAIRGRLVCMFELGWQIGGLVGFWINYGIELHDPSGWLIPFAVQLIPSGILFAGSFWLHESPRWLMSKGRREEAVKNLCWIRELDEDDLYIKEEMYAIDRDIERQMAGGGMGFWQPFKLLASNRHIQWRFFLGGSLFFWQNASGINAINYYSPTVFKSIGVVGLNTSLFTTGLFGVVKTVFTIFYLVFLIDQYGRRRLLMIGATGGSLCLWYVGAYIAIAKPALHPTKTLPPSGVSAIFFFYVWTAFYSPTWNPTPWVYNSEMFDQNVRTLAQAFAAMNNWFWNFMVSRFTPQMFTTMGYGVYFFFAALMICSVVFVYFFMPETKNIPLEGIDRLFDRRLKASQAHSIVWKELAEEEAALRVGLTSGTMEKDTTTAQIEDVEQKV
ncbi:putative quinate permease [Hyaloscypha variabilis F]|uniref:Quinate transporter n=1 Tax=Hyaloscypha variabilis (strain UAMH 11265 / GT02V1 / F) TaxID=1149755 RepID=A0A2J6RGB4_HYAVF|nr:putative quinate permease [Hyaloscypha variabilis F]